jgi:protein translocase subunit secE/sec61 gamma
MAIAKEKEKERRGNNNHIVRIYNETRTELRKVVWPTREETIRLTIVVIAVSAAIGMLLFLGDTVFIWLYGLLLEFVQ